MTRLVGLLDWHGVNTVMQQIAKNFISKDLKDEILINMNGHAFMEIRSCQRDLIYFCDDIIRLVKTIHLDFFKTFN